MGITTQLPDGVAEMVVRSGDQLVRFQDAGLNEDQIAAADALANKRIPSAVVVLTSELED